MGSASPCPHCSHPQVMFSTCLAGALLFDPALQRFSSFDLSPTAEHTASAGLGVLEPIPFPALSHRAQPFIDQECLLKICF